MEEMRIYITNLGKYNEGELVGAWFTPPVDFEEVREVLFEAGKEISINENYHNCIELFKVINNYLIDGMPCDKGIKIMSQEENQIIYEYNEMVHQYLDFEIFQKYRKAWLDGVLSDSHIVFSRLNYNTYMLKMEE